MSSPSSSSQPPTGGGGTGFLKFLRQQRPLILGLIVAPLGLYCGMKIKEHRQKEQYPPIPSDLVVAGNTGSSGKNNNSSELGVVNPDKPEAIHAELVQLTGYRATLARDRELLMDEKRTIESKLKRLDELDKKVDRSR
ncbi:hypothetical protein EV182_001938, partial [Spiromyces aspiralis]